MNKRRGFSIIEVALVLGIAGIIFMMAFIALPSLWASERDADRKAKVMEFISDLKTYQTNNSRGALPVGTSGNFTRQDAQSTPGTDVDSWRAFVRDYVNADFKDPKDDPDGSGIRFYIKQCATNATGVNVTCDGQDDTRVKNVNSGAMPSSDLDYTMYVLIGAVCDGDHAVKSSNARDVAAVYVLERAGRYCHSTR